MPLTNLSEIQSSFYALEEYFSGSISLKKHIAGNDSIAYFAEIDEPKFNVLLQRSMLDEPEVVISSAKEFFAQNNIYKWVYVVPSKLDTQLLKNVLQNNNFTFEETSKAMGYSFGQNLNEHKPYSLSIQAVEPNQNDWLKILQAAFGGTDETIAQYSQALQRAKTKGTAMQHFMGNINNQPVAAITLTFLNDCVKIDNVATHPNHQRLGYASQMMQFAMNLSQALKVKHCFLDASSNGLEVYKRLGFSEIFTYHIYGCEGLK